MNSSKQLNLSDLRNESIREALIAVASRADGRVNPHAVVEEASDPASVLHQYFEWDDNEAGARYRLAQAEGLIRRVKLTIMRRDPESKTVAVTSTRAFQNRTSQRKDANGGYESIEDIMADSSKRNELLAQVLKEMQSYRKRYAELRELSSIWAAIDDALVDIGPLPSDLRTPEDRPSA